LSHARLSSEHALRPGDRGARRIVEILDAEVFERRQIVIPQDRMPQARTQQRDALVGVRSVPHDIAKTQHFIGWIHQRKRALE
jgi:hypothetical protein